MELVCILCPKGCHLQVSQDQSGQWFVQGNECPRGKHYAVQEAECPMRTLTTSVWVDNGDYKMVSIKTDKEIPKDKIEKALSQVAGMHVEAPISIGQIILKNVAGTSANFIATRKVERV